MLENEGGSGEDGYLKMALQKGEGGGVGVFGGGKFFFKEG
jgi:hypothetical protein